MQNSTQFFTEFLLGALAAARPVTFKKIAIATGSLESVRLADKKLRTADKELRTTAAAEFGSGRFLDLHP